MVYRHKVKHNGKWYLPGQDVPEDVVPETKHDNTEVKENQPARRGRKPKQEE